MKIILTGATGMVGQGVLLTLLERSDVQDILSVSRKPSGLQNPKLKEILHKDFQNINGYSKPILEGKDIIEAAKKA